MVFCGHVQLENILETIALYDLWRHQLNFMTTVTHFRKHIEKSQPTMEVKNKKNNVCLNYPVHLGYSQILLLVISVKLVHTL